MLCHSLTGDHNELMKSLRGKPAADRDLGSRETERQTAKDEKINEQDDTEGQR